MLPPMATLLTIHPEACVVLMVTTLAVASPLVHPDPFEEGVEDPLAVVFHPAIPTPIDLYVKCATAMVM